ncbi:hypothetical protein OE88DRAFT_1734227 [Heliocybe sulcata]|uniref:Uncharacterized protein n=1 Tax=Heliocybe sulcata TaxID=5364 RepID=A0A5C3N5R1_9AGAM|nr:hypothetical protein OE88DRAFT_1734227 [Heliocybe sulcata]
MNLIASPSRSSGLEKDGDTLKDFKVQEEYRDFIQGKLDSCLQKFPPSGDATQSTQRTEVEQNILILFRKLREGISSSHRKDEFALEVYETSLVLATLFRTPLQATTTLSYLLPGLYYASSSESLRQQGRLSITLISLLHHLVAAYPSQAPFHQHLPIIPASFLPRGSQASKWISSIASALRTNDYMKLGALTQLSAIQEATSGTNEKLATPSPSESHLKSSTRHLDPGLANEALLTLVDALRTKARARIWLTLRSAYRELWCQSEYDTSEWLESTLALKSLKAGQASTDAGMWLGEREKEGDVRKKEGSDSRWILIKPKQ